MIPIMLLQSNMTIVIATSFYYNQNYIEKYLCIQRDMVNNTCHGQCYLMKKIKDKQENEQKNFKIYLYEANFVAVNSMEIPAIATFYYDKAAYPLYRSDMTPADYNQAVFRPPLVG